MGKESKDSAWKVWLQSGTNCEHLTDDSDGKESKCFSLSQICTIINHYHFLMMDIESGCMIKYMMSTKKDYKSFYMRLLCTLYQILTKRHKQILVSPATLAFNAT